MTTRARELLNKSRALLDGSRTAASQLLGPQQSRLGQARGTPSPATGPRASSPVGTGHGRARQGSARQGSAGQGAAGQSSQGVAAVGISPAGPSAAEEALTAICADLALRDLNLVDSLLAQLEDMESREEDADRLAELYRLDHLAARLRRNAENLRVLAGSDAGDSAAQTSSLVDVIRGAMSSIDHYQRITVGRVVNLGVVGFAAEDVSRLVAELLDNATKSSPPHSPVRVGAHLTEQGSALLRIEDEGIGLPPDRLGQLNDRLEAEPVLDDDAVRHMGLAVVCRLAARHEIKTWLDHRHPHGTTASVLLPAQLVCELPDLGWSGLRTVVTPPSATGPSTIGPSATGPSATGEGPAAAPGSDRLTNVAVLADRLASANGRVGGRAAAVVAGVREARPVTADGGRSGGGTSAAVRTPATSATTSSGLPRRISRSLRGSVDVGDGAPPAGTQAPGRMTGAGGTAQGTKAPTEAEVRAGHAKLLADLGAFSEGEQAARDELRRD